MFELDLALVQLNVHTKFGDTRLIPAKVIVWKLAFSQSSVLPLEAKNKNRYICMRETILLLFDRFQTKFDNVLTNLI
jgi:hypothetical protein